MMINMAPLIITTAALINVLDISKRNKQIRVVINGAGASAIACSDLFMKKGVPKKKSITMIDRKGVIYKGRDNL